MAAGNQTDHYIQDATEQDLVYRVQKLLVLDNLAVTDDWQEKKKEFDDRLVEGGIVKKYPKSDQAGCIDISYSLIYQQLKNYRSNIKFDIIWIGRDGRNESKKGDFILVYEDGKVVSYSLKVYKNGFASIQVRSGTYNSTFLSIILKEFALPDVGMYSNPIPEEEWKNYSNRKYVTKFSGGQSLAIRDVVLKYLGLDDAIDVIHQLDKVRTDSIHRFKNDPTTRNIKDHSTKLAWERQCEIAGNKAASLICGYLKKKDINMKEFVLKQIGFSGDEELVALSPTNYLVSTNNTQYKEVVLRSLSEEAFVDYDIRGKGIGFSLKDKKGDIIEVNIPFTLNKNGAWWSRVKEFEGKRPYPGTGKDAGTMLSYGEWRPQKSGEMATSTNTYVELKKAGVY